MELDAADGIDGDLAACECAAVESPEGDERVPDSARVAALAEHAVDEVLNVEAGDLGQLRAAEVGQDAQAHRGLVAAQDTRLVRIARAVADRPVTRTLEPRLPDFSKRRRRGARIVPRRRATSVSARQAFASSKLRKVLRMRLRSRALQTCAW